MSQMSPPPCWNFQLIDTPNTLTLQGYVPGPMNMYIYINIRTYKYEFVLYICITNMHVYIYIYIPGIPTTPVFGVVRRKTSDFGVVRERPQKCNLRFFKKTWYTSYVMKTCPFIIKERGFFCHGSWFNMQFRSERKAYIQKNHATSSQIPPSHWRAPYIQSVHKYMYIYV